MAILSFHDSVELFLQLCVDHLPINVSKKDIKFMEYWKVIEEKGNRVIFQKSSMSQLNSARVSFKHHGNIPSKLDIETFRATTNAFFTENCNLVFCIDFNEVSLIDAIKFDRTKKKLKEAKISFEKGEEIEYLRDIILSFRYLLSDYEQSKMNRLNRSPFFFGESLDFSRQAYIQRFEDKILEQWGDGVNQVIENLIKSTQEIQEVVKILSLGIDYRKYAKFRLIIQPVAVHIADDDSFETIKLNEISLCKENLDFCMDFIVESALKLQDFDFEIGKLG